MVDLNKGILSNPDFLGQQDLTGTTESTGFEFTPEKMAEITAGQNRIGINDFYQQHLGRDSLSDGMDFWLGKMDGGMTLEQVGAGIAGSEEGLAYLNNQTTGPTTPIAQDPGQPIIDNGPAGAFTPNQDINSFYQQHLGRDALQDGMAFWQGKLDSGDMTLEQIGEAIRLSEEGVRYANQPDPNAPPTDPNAPPVDPNAPPVDPNVGILEGATPHGYTPESVIPTGYDAADAATTTGYDVDRAGFSGYDASKADYTGYDATRGGSTGYTATGATAEGYSAVRGDGGQGYTADNSTAEGYDAEEYTPDTNALATETLNRILQQDNPYIQQARFDGRKSAAKRGLLNSSISAGAAQQSAIRAAQPFAITDSGRYFDSGMEGVRSRNEASRFSAGERNKVGIVNAQLNSRASEFTADAMNMVDRDFANAENNALQFGANARNQTAIEYARAINDASKFGAAAFNLSERDFAQAKNEAMAFGARAFNIAESDFANAVNRSEEFEAGAENLAEITNSQEANTEARFEASAENLAEREATLADSRSEEFAATEANRAATRNADAIDRAGAAYASSQDAASIVNANNELSLALQDMRDQLSTYATDAQRDTALDRIASDMMRMALDNGIFNNAETATGFFSTVAGILPSLGIQIAADLADEASEDIV